MPSFARTTPPFRADHVGSFLRPERLARARALWKEGGMTGLELRAVEDECVRDVIAMQEGVGLKGITDGDYRRDDWFLDVMYALDGVEPSGAFQDVQFSGGLLYEAPLGKVTDKVRYPEDGIGREALSFLVKATTQTAKVAIPSPAMFHVFIYPEVIDRAVYPDPDGFWADLGQAYSDMVQDYARLGCRYIQLDDVNSANLADERWRGFWTSVRGREPEDMLDAFIALNNAAVAARPAGMTAVIHMCKGNYQSQFAGEGSYDQVAERFFNGCDVDGFFLEYDDERSGGFEPLRFVPADKMVVLGLVTSKRPELEDKDEIKARIEEAARHVPLQRLCLSPQCGFASTHHGNRLTEDEQKRKLEHLVEIAAEVWGGV